MLGDLLEVSAAVMLLFSYIIGSSIYAVSEKQERYESSLLAPLPFIATLATLVGTVLTSSMPARILATSTLYSSCLILYSYSST